MARVKWNDKGLSELMEGLASLSKKSMKDIAGAGLYEMANVVANAIKSKLNGLTTEEEEPFKGHRAQYLSQRQKDGLVESFGIATMRADGNGWNVLLGFDGYNRVRTKKYSGGQPNVMIARSVESGSTYMIKQPFFRTAVNASKSAAKKAGQQAVIDEFEKVL